LRKRKVVKMEKLQRGISFLFLIGLSSYLYSCNGKNQESITKNELQCFLENYYGKSYHDYLFKSISDSIDTWENVGIERYNNTINAVRLIDSIICLNKDKDKLFTVMYLINGDKTTFDDIIYFYGVKIKDKWYYFDGETQPVARNDRKIPSTFKQLSKIAFDDVFQYYLKRNEKGELEINESIFSSLNDVGWAEGDEGIMPKTKEEWDQRYLRAANERRSKIDTSDYSNQ
jgi:hypothetical protein